MLQGRWDGDVGGGVQLKKPGSLGVTREFWRKSEVGDRQVVRWSWASTDVREPWEPGKTEGKGTAARIGFVPQITQSLCYNEATYLFTFHDTLICSSFHFHLLTLVHG